MRFETLKSSKKKYFLYALVVGVALLLPLVLTFSKAKYKVTQSIKIVEGTIKNYSPADLNILAIKIQNASGEYYSSNNVPESGYTLNETESYCTIPNGNGENTTDTDIPMEYKDGKVYIGVNTKGTKCYLYFDKTTMTIQDILAIKTISTRTNFSTTLTTDTTGRIFTAEDDYGISYYFAGNPTDNWVKFAGFYWRIIRINGDGSVRLIYQGTAANKTGTGTQTTTSTFNSSRNNNMYVGFMYTNNQVHGRETASTIKGVLDTWYNNNLLGYASYIVTGGGATFCNDRQPSTSNSSLNGSGGTGTTTTYYAAGIRLYAGSSTSNAAPSFKCMDSSDRFDTSIGLITADEVAYAGGIPGTANSGYYLYTNQHYWTMSPYSTYSNDGAIVFRVNNGGYLSYAYVSAALGVRPVINLKADTTFIYGATGTAENPYVIQ